MSSKDKARRGMCACALRGSASASPSLFLRALLTPSRGNGRARATPKLSRVWCWIMCRRVVIVTHSVAVARAVAIQIFSVRCRSEAYFNPVQCTRVLNSVHMCNGDVNRRKHERSRSPRCVRESSRSPRRSGDRKGEKHHRRSKSRSKSRDKRRKRHSVSVSSSSSSGSESDSSDESESSDDDRKRSSKRSSSSKKHAKKPKKSSDSKKKKKKTKDSHKKKTKKSKSKNKRHDSDSDSDSDSDTVRSAISGKKIKRKLSRTATDLQHQKNRQQLLQFYNGMYD